MGKLATGFQGESFQATFLEMLISLSFLFSSFIGVHYGTSILLQASRLNGKHERNLTLMNLPRLQLQAAQETVWGIE